MDAHVKVSGAWKTLEGIHTKVGGVWKEVLRGYINVGGTWKQFYGNASAMLSGSTGTPNADSDYSIGGTAQAGWTFETTGDLVKVSGSAWAQPEWYGQSGDTTHQTPDQTYYIRATNNSGSNPDSGPALNTWHALSSQRSWYWESTGLGSSTGSIKVEIASDSGGTDIVATGYYSGLAESE